MSLLSTFVCAVESSEGDDKERRWVFPSVNQVREGPFGVTVTSQTLDKSEPRRKTLDHRTDTVGVGITHIFTCIKYNTMSLVIIRCWFIIIGSVFTALSCILSYSLTFTTDESIMFFPVQFKTVETDHVLQIHQNHDQRVQLVSQPEVCKANTMKWSCHHSKLWRKTKRGRLVSLHNKLKEMDEIN